MNHFFCRNHSSSSFFFEKIILLILFYFYLICLKIYNCTQELKLLPTRLLFFSQILNWLVDLFIELNVVVSLLVPLNCDCMFSAIKIVCNPIFHEYIDIDCHFIH